MRIIGGEWRGMKLADLGAGDVNARLRPTSDRVRESVFNLLINGKHGNPVEGGHVLDLFAGTGANGLESLSRGAAHATFIDSGATAIRLIEANTTRARSEDRVAVRRLDATRLGRNAGQPFDLIFLDPPYGKGMGERAVATALQGDWLADEAIIVWEEAKPPLVPAEFCVLEQRRYGESVITILRKSDTV